MLTRPLTLTVGWCQLLLKCQSNVGSKQSMIRRHPSLGRSHGHLQKNQSWLHIAQRLPQQKVKLDRAIQTDLLLKNLDTDTMLPRLTLLGHPPYPAPGQYPAKTARGHTNKFRRALLNVAAASDMNTMSKFALRVRGCRARRSVSPRVTHLPA